MLELTFNKKLGTIHFSQLHLHNRLQSRLAFPQEQELQLPLHEHLTNSLVHFPTSGMVIQTGIHLLDSSFQPKLLREGSCGFAVAALQLQPSMCLKIQKYFTYIHVVSFTLTSLNFFYTCLVNCPFHMLQQRILCSDFWQKLAFYFH